MGSNGLAPDSLRCGHCGSVFIQNKHLGHQKTYCTVKCRKSAAHMRRYYMRKRGEPDHAMQDSERKLNNAAAWRDKAKAEGRCTRCGRENDRAHQGLNLCTNCVIALKGGP